MAAVGWVTFAAHRRLPYRRLLVLTGVMIGVVLVVMVGETAQELQLAGWLPTTSLQIPLPSWTGLWLATFPTLEGLLLQAMAIVLVLGSYLAAEHLRVRRPRRTGQPVASRPDTSPAYSDA